MCPFEFKIHRNYDKVDCIPELQKFFKNTILKNLFVCWISHQEGSKEFFAFSLTLSHKY